MRTLILLGLSILGAVGSVASAAAQTAASPAPIGSPADVQALRERAAAFWAARLAGDYRTQWELLEPRGKGRVSAEEYRPWGDAVRYLAHQIEGATVNGYFGTVTVRLLYQLVLPQASSRRIPAQVALVGDGWVRIGGVWYRRLDQGESQLPQTAQP